MFEPITLPPASSVAAHVQPGAPHRCLIGMASAAINSTTTIQTTTGTLVNADLVSTRKHHCRQVYAVRGTAPTQRALSRCAGKLSTRLVWQSVT